MSRTYDIGQRLKFLMKLNNCTIGELAAKANISEDTIKSIRSGKTKNPSLHVLTAIADAFPCTLDNLIGRFPKDIDEVDLIRKWRSLDTHGRSHTMYVIDNELHSQPVMQDKTREFKYYTATVYLGNGASFEKSHPEYIDIASDHMKDAAFGFKVTNDSLIPDYFPNDIIAIATRLPLPGEIALYEKDTVIYVRKNIIYNGVNRLIPLHATYNEVELKNTADYNCIGTVLGVIRQAI